SSFSSAMGILKLLWYNILDAKPKLHGPGKTRTEVRARQGTGPEGPPLLSRPEYRPKPPSAPEWPERRLEPLDPSALYGDHVEPTDVARAAGALEPGRGGAGQLALLAPPHGLHGGAVELAEARFDLYEH